MSDPPTTTSIQPELWVDAPQEALRFYEAALGASVIHLVGEGEEIVAQLRVGAAVFWIAPPSAALRRLSPHTAGGGTSRMMLVVADPESVLRAAVAAGAEQTSPVAEEHGWQVGRITDPFGHEWEIARPPAGWDDQKPAAAP